VALTLLATVCVAAPADSSPAKRASAGKLKWRAKGSVTPAVATHAAPAAHQRSVQRAVVHQPAASNQSSRARLREAIMQVSSVEDEVPTDESAAPADEAPAAELTAQLPADAPADEPSAAAPADSAAPAADPFAEEPVPAPPTPATAEPGVASESPDSQPAAVPELPTTEPTAPANPALPGRAPARDELPPSDLSQGISTSSPANCNEYQAECKRAITELLKRDITTIRVGLEISGVEGEDFPCDCKAGMGLLDASMTEFKGRNWCRTNFAWKASGLCHKPLYFEDVQLERYGHSWNPVLQPFMSAGHFFASVALLPYHMGINPPHECVYALGYYRPGSCAPYMIEPFPLSLRGAAFEAAAVTGFYFWLYP
jgi:hypothetical protein